MLVPSRGVTLDQRVLVRLVLDNNHQYFSKRSHASRMSFMLGSTIDSR